MLSWKANNDSAKEIYPELHEEKSRVALPNRKIFVNNSSTVTTCRQEDLGEKEMQLPLLIP